MSDSLPKVRGDFATFPCAMNLDDGPSCPNAMERFERKCPTCGEEQVVYRCIVHGVVGFEGHGCVKFGEPWR